MRSRTQNFRCSVNYLCLYKGSARFVLRFVYPFFSPIWLQESGGNVSDYHSNNHFSFKALASEPQRSRKLTVEVHKS